MGEDFENKSFTITKDDFIILYQDFDDYCIDYVEPSYVGGRISFVLTEEKEKEIKEKYPSVDEDCSVASTWFVLDENDDVHMEHHFAFNEGFDLTDEETALIENAFYEEFGGKDKLKQALKEYLFGDEKEDKNMSSKYVITIFDNGGEELYGASEEWKTCVYEDFDETFVIKGNKDFHNIDSAEWYKKTTDLITELCESMETYEDLLSYKETAKELYKDNVEWYKENYGINEEQLFKICNILNDCRNTDDLETERDVARVLYPDKDLIITEIRGYMQGDWNECLYDCKKVDDKTIDRLSDFYFGDVNAIRVQEFDANVSKEDYDNETAEEEYFDYMAGSECYNMTHSRDVIKDFREHYGIADECSIEILHATGTLVQTVSYSYETIAESIQTIGKASVNKTKGAERE